MISFLIKKNKLYIHQYIVINILFSIILFIFYTLLQKNNINHLLYNLIFINKQPINNYLFNTLIYITITILSATSFVGTPIISLSLLYRIFSIINSLILIPINSLTLSKVIIIIPQILIELIISYLLAYMATYLSIQSFKLTFITKDNFSFKLLFNYILNYLILVIVGIFLSSLIKIYLI